MCFHHQKGEGGTGKGELDEMLEFLKGHIKKPTESLLTLSRLF
ncbi:hypothetical protein UF75_3321 [Desulfosporosinus sp. I2]|nr:hypothetical protein UF75_3321 [Desulfosporosinus sp. I2]